MKLDSLDRRPRPAPLWALIKPRPGNLRLWQAGLLLALFVFWYLMTTPGLLPNFMFENDQQAAFFFGEPLKVLGRVWRWFVLDADIYSHLWVTLVETLLAFVIGSAPRNSSTNRSRFSRTCAG